VSIGELFDIACSALGVSARAVQDAARVRPDASEVLVLLSDPSKARTRLDWTPAVSVEDGVARTASWLRGHAHLYSAERYHV
jgi:UDP-glucose 4-epimerase